MKYLTSILLLASSSAFAGQFTYLEYGLSSYDSDAGLKYNSNRFGVSYEVDKHVAVLAGVEVSDSIKNSDVAKMVNDKLGNQNTITSAAGSTTVDFGNGSFITFPTNEKDSGSDSYVGLKGFSDFAHRATSYVDIKYHAKTVYGTAGTGFSGRFGVLFPPAKRFQPLKLGFFVEAQSTKIDNINSDIGLTAASNKLKLDLTERAAGAEVLYNIKQFSVGLEYKASQLDHKFTVNTSDELSGKASFTDNYKILKLYGQWHF